MRSAEGKGNQRNSQLVQYATGLVPAEHVNETYYCVGGIIDDSDPSKITFSVVDSFDINRFAKPTVRGRPRTPSRLRGPPTWTSASVRSRSATRRSPRQRLRGGRCGTGTTRTTSRTTLRARPTGAGAARGGGVVSPRGRTPPTASPAPAPSCAPRCAMRQLVAPPFAPARVMSQTTRLARSVRSISTPSSRPRRRNRPRRHRHHPSRRRCRPNLQRPPRRRPTLRRRLRHRRRRSARSSPFGSSTTVHRSQP